MSTLDEMSAHPYDAVDLFSGPRGWSVGARRLGIHDVGLEWDESACQTSVAAGFDTIRADVAQYDPTRFRGIAGLIASPPCQSYSQAGTGDGRGSIAELAKAMGVILEGGPDPRPEVRDHIYGRIVRAEIDKATEIAKRTNQMRSEARQLDDEAVERIGMQAGTKKARQTAYNAALVLEPARWVHAMEPEWVALEQVPAVLPLWQALAGLLQRSGYSSWAGILNAADFGVPQTRERAILVAHRSKIAAPPVPTHAKRGAATEPDLFGEQRLPWVSMAEALGWGELLRPSTTVTTPGASGGGGRSVIDGGSNSRRAREGRIERGEFSLPQVGFARRGEPGDDPETLTEDGYRKRDLRSIDEPAQVVTEKARMWTVRTGMNSMSSSRDPQDMVPYERSVDEPAPTVDAKVGSAWKVAPEGEHVDPPMRWKDGDRVIVNTGNDWKKGGTREDAQQFDASDQPAPALTGQAGKWRVEVRRGGEEVELLPGGAGYENPNRRPYGMDEPAPTIAFGNDASGWKWRERGDEPPAGIVDTGNTCSGTREEGRWRDLDDPAPVVTTRADQLEWRERRNDQSGPPKDPDWPLERPATTVATRGLIPDPGHTINASDPEGTKSRNDGYRVTVQEAAVLQSFPPDHPWRGSKSKQFEQVGNAVPCGLAQAVLAALLR